MKLTDLFLAQLGRETTISRRVLQRVPEGKPDWKPHEKSAPLWYVAFLVASMPSWMAMAVVQDSLDLSPPGGSSYRPEPWKKIDELLRTLAESTERAREALAAATDEHLSTKWRLMAGGRTVDESPRYVVVADTFSHIAHHRAQLTVYLRLNDIPVPSVYGPTADERGF
jgi:uncharacterized damage-inducible protein DinB